MLNTQLVTTRESLECAVRYFKDRPEFAFDVETVGPHRGVPAVNEVSWITLATTGATTVIPMGHPNGRQCLQKATWRKGRDGKRENIPAQFTAPPVQLRPDQVFEALEPLFFSDRVKVAHNAPFDLLSIAKHYDGAFPPPPYGDTIVAAWLNDENRLIGLKPLTTARYGLTYDHDNVGKAVEKHTFSDVQTYAYLDGKATWLHWKDLRPRITSAGLESIWDLEMGVLHCLLHMQNAGAPIDVAALEKLRDELRERLIGIEADVYRAAGTVFNIGSVPQKQRILYDRTQQGLIPRKRTDKGAPSTDAEALAAYKGKNKVVDHLLEYQEVSKVLGTYVEGYLGTDEKPTQIFNGRIYPAFAQYGTVTGRFSCRAPNVQNWPRPDTPVGKAIRDLFEPPPGFCLLVADYAQIELRILAHFAGAGKLYDGFWAGMDAHVATASSVFGVTPEDVTKAMRQVAKALAFAIAYGAGPELVAAMAGISVRRAEQFMRRHELEFPEIYLYKEKLLRVVRGRRPVPYLRTLLGRMRRLPDLNSRIPKLRMRAERQVVNSHIQGSNADITKLAMVRLHESLLPGMQIMLTVHDELAVLCPRDIADSGAKVLHEAMAGQAMQLMSVPVTTDVKICDRWSQAK